MAGDFFSFWVLLVLQSAQSSRAAAQNHGYNCGNGEDGKLVAQSYVMWLYGAYYSTPARITFAHRGGYYVKPTEVFGPGVIY